MKDNTGFQEMLEMEQRRHAFSEEEKCLLLKTLTQRLGEHSDVRFAFVHGSFLEDIHCRDIDIAVYFEPTLNTETLYQLALRLAAELTSLVHITVDVHPLNLASTAFAYYATQGELILSRDHEETFGFVENTWLAYMDFSSFTRQLIVDLAD